MNDPGLAILGAGCVTSLGRDWEAVYGKICAGVVPVADTLCGPGGMAPMPVFKTEQPEVPSNIAARLRRSSAISYFACAAAADAVRQAGPLPEGRTALVFAASDGAVVYTRRFFEEVVARGTGSPLLFPETVYNAPASHVAAMLGLDGIVLTLVSDATAGTDALSTASDLIHSGAADCCLVVAAEELDWISCEGYRSWKLTGSGQGAILSEGAVALVLGAATAQELRIARIHPGRTLHRGSSKHPGLEQFFAELVHDDFSPDAAILSTSGARNGLAEESVIRKLFPGISLFAPKKIAGEGFSTSTLLQLLCAREEILRGRARNVLVPVSGWSQQVGGAILTGPKESGAVR